MMVSTRDSTTEFADPITESPQLQGLFERLGRLGPTTHTLASPDMENFDADLHSQNHTEINGHSGANWKGP
jgi:hypothetical protein